MIEQTRLRAIVLAILAVGLAGTALAFAYFKRPPTDRAADHIERAATQAPPNPSESYLLSDAAAADQIATALRRKQFIDYIGDTYRCSDYFTVRSARVSARKPGNDTVSFEALVELQAQGVGGGIMSLSARESAELKCYGRPPEGWTPGQISSGPFIADFERWGDEWRLVGMPRNAVFN